MSLCHFISTRCPKLWNLRAPFSAVMNSTTTGEGSSQCPGLCHFQLQTVVHATADELFRFHENPQNIGIVMPPTTRVVKVVCAPVARAGDVMELHLKEMGMIPLRVTGRWAVVEPGRLLVDEMLSGPFRVMVHHHIFADLGDGTSLLTDDVYYTFGRGLIGCVLSQTGVRLYLHLLFAWRHHRTRRWFAIERHHDQSSAPSI